MTKHFNGVPSRNLWFRNIIFSTALKAILKCELFPNRALTILSYLMKIFRNLTKIIS